jgi:hypothetical protein
MASARSRQRDAKRKASIALTSAITPAAVKPGVGHGRSVTWRVVV